MRGEGSESEETWKREETGNDDLLKAAPDSVTRGSQIAVIVSVFVNTINGFIANLRAPQICSLTQQPHQHRQKCTQTSLTSQQQMDCLQSTHIKPQISSISKTYQSGSEVFLKAQQRFITDFMLAIER